MQMKDDARLQSFLAGFEFSVHTLWKDCTAVVTTFRSLVPPPRECSEVFVSSESTDNRGRILHTTHWFPVVRLLCSAWPLSPPSRKLFLRALTWKECTAVQLSCVSLGLMPSSMDGSRYATPSTGRDFTSSASSKWLCISSFLEATSPRYGMICAHENHPWIGLGKL